MEKETIQDKINIKIKEIDDYMLDIGSDVEDFDYIISSNGKHWEIEISGMSSDGEEQTYNFDCDNIDNLLNVIKENF